MLVHLKDNLLTLIPQLLSTKMQLKDDSSVTSIPNSLQMTNQSQGRRKKKSYIFI